MFFLCFLFLKNYTLNKHIILLEHKMVLSCHYSCFDYCTGRSILHQKLNINFHIFLSGVSHSLLRRKEEHLITAPLAYEMQNRLCKIFDESCNMQRNKASLLLCHQRAAQDLNLNHRSITIVTGSFLSQILSLFSHGSH